MHVLVVEDEMLVMVLIKGLLADLGCTDITVASNIKTALEYLAGNSFNLAILDVNLHGSRSYPVAEALDARNIPFAFSTGYAREGIDEKYVNRAVLKKPYSCSNFKAVIENLLAEGRTLIST